MDLKLPNHCLTLYIHIQLFCYHYSRSNQFTVSFIQLVPQTITKHFPMGKLEVEVKTKSPADKVWEAVKDTHSIFPKIFPDRYKSVSILEGDGKSVGSVILSKYVEGAPAITFSKEKIEEVDEAKKSMAYSVIDGELSVLYKTFKASLQIIPDGDGSLVKWSLEYEKASEAAPEPSFVQEFAVKTFEGIDAYIQKS